MPKQCSLLIISVTNKCQHGHQKQKYSEQSSYGTTQEAWTNSLRLLAPYSCCKPAPGNTLSDVRINFLITCFFRIIINDNIF